MIFGNILLFIRCRNQNQIKWTKTQNSQLLFWGISMGIFVKCFIWSINFVLFSQSLVSKSYLQLWICLGFVNSTCCKGHEIRRKRHEDFNLVKNKSNQIWKAKILRNTIQKYLQSWQIFQNADLDFENWKSQLSHCSFGGKFWTRPYQSNQVWKAKVLLNSILAVEFLLYLNPILGGKFEPKLNTSLMPIFCRLVGACYILCIVKILPFLPLYAC